MERQLGHGPGAHTKSVANGADKLGIGSRDGEMAGVCLRRALTGEAGRIKDAVGRTDSMPLPGYRRNEKVPADAKKPLKSLFLRQARAMVH